MQKRIQWIDIAKGIAIICVIVGHTLDVGSPFRKIIFSFHMPLFFILAGYTFKARPMRDVLLTSSKRLFIPYCLLSVLWLSRSIVVDYPSVSSVDFVSYLEILVMGSGYVTPSGIPAIGMPWFLASMFMSRIIFNALLCLSDRLALPRAAEGLASALVCAVGMLLGSRIGIYLPLSLDVSFVTVLFMWCGYQMKCAGYLEKENPSCLLGIVMLVLWAVALFSSSFELATRTYRNPVFAMAGALSGTYVVVYISMFTARHLRKIGNALAWCGKNSLLVFCFHATDWTIPWVNLPILGGVPFSHFFASLIRSLYNVGWTVLVKMV